MRGFLRLLLLGLAISPVACGGSDVALPVPAEKLPAVLADVHIAESAMQRLSGDTKDSMAHVYYQQIYERYQIKEEDLTATLSVLQDNPVQLMKVYERVNELLEQMEEEQQELPGTRRN